MSNNFYTTKTAALKATKADIRNLNAQEIKLKDKSILDYISDSEFNSYDSRDPQLKNDELDIWNTAISLSDNGHIEVKPNKHTYEEMTDEQKELLLNSAAQVIDDEVLDTDGNHLMYWQTNGLIDACHILDRNSDGLDDAELSVFYHYTYNDDNYDELSNSNLTVFSSDLSSLKYGYSMFNGCSQLESFSSDLSSLEDGYYMFVDCTNLTSFATDLSSLTDGSSMFRNCTNLTTFSSDSSGSPVNLSSLTSGTEMFAGCIQLVSFSSDLSSLQHGYGMFTYCLQLESFSSDLSSLMYGDDMFGGCENLTSFSSSLPSLTRGYEMFSYCKLDSKSVANIIHTLPINESEVGITIGIGCDDTEADQLLFAQECDCDTWQELLDEFSAKNWTVEFQCNGRPTTTYNMRRGESLPIYTKLEEVIMPTDEKKRKPHYKYTSQDGSKFYNINYFHSTNGSTEGYDVFSSLEEAISTYNVTPKN